jgi:hypothetical protein
MRAIALLVTTISFSFTTAQVVENFEDGDFKDGNPLTWFSSQISGNEDFIISNGEIQSNGPSASGNLYLSTNLGIDFNQNDVVWTFKARYTASGPSSSNRIEIYLISDTEIVSVSPNGYYIRMGESGSGDGIDLFKTSSSDPIINDQNDLVGSEIDANIRVTRTTFGDWTVEADPTGGNDLRIIGSITDTEFASGDYFGFYVKHTSSRNDDFFFDDFTLSLIPQVDLEPPYIESVQAISNTQIEVLFSENVGQVPAESVENYSLDGNVRVEAANRDSQRSILYIENQ